MTIGLNISITPATIAAFFAELLALHNPQLDRIEAALKQVIQEQNQMAIDVTKLVAAVAAEKTVVASAITLLNGQTQTLKDLSAQLAAAIANGDPAAIAAAQDAIDQAASDSESATADLANAVAANTVASTEPPPAA